MKLPNVRLSVRQVIATTAIVAVLLGLVRWVVSDFVADLQIKFADDQTAIFDEMRSKTAESAGVDVRYLEYVL
jgi:hypothetical protein